MADYARQNDFSAKDALSTGDAAKLIKGSEVDAEFDAIVTAVATKQTVAKGADLSSANTLTIGTDGNYFDVEGTTQINTMTVAINRSFTLQFDGALVLQHHATNLDLPTEANITTAAGDVAQFFSHTANQVQCVNYTRADGTAPAGGGAGGLEDAGGNIVGIENHVTTAGSFTVTNGKNLVTGGPFTIASGHTVTVGSGETWTVV